MDDTLHAQFQRIEAALGTLVDSIAAYNPSPQAAVDLIAADDELSRGLDKRACPPLPLRVAAHELTACSYAAPSEPHPHPVAARRGRCS